MNIPLPPDIEDDLLESCRNTGDYCPVMFEWYKYSARLANYFSCLELRSPALIDISQIHNSVLIGLLNRCSRLMLANVTLSHEGAFGETTAILDRCIFESAIKLIWLCHVKKEEYFNRFIAEGLKTEVELKKKIQENIANQSGRVKAIEKQMLNSIENYFKKSELSEETIEKLPKLPNIAQMIEKNGSDRLAYIVGQRIGSHHVHGSWVSLWFHYLKEEDGIVSP